MDRRSFLIGGARTVGAAAVLGTGGNLLHPRALSTGAGRHGAERATSHNTGGKPHGAPRRGGSLSIGTEAEDNGIDPTGSDFDATGIMYARAFYDPLAATTATGRTVPYLAQSIEPNGDYTVWTIAARRGVVFHDGTDFNAAAIVANFHAQITSAISGPILSTLISDVVPTDDMTVQVSLTSPWVPFDTYLAGWIGGQFAYMASPKSLAAGTLADHPVGTGPFVFEDWVPNDHLTGTRNPNYWRAGMPYVDAVTFRPMPDDQTRVDALESGSIDLMHVTDVAHYKEARANPGFSWVDNLDGEYGEPDQDFLMLNTLKPPLDDLRIRQALAHALDTSAYNQTANEGVTPVDLSPFAKGSPSYSANGYPTYNLAKAKALLKGYERDNGGPVRISVGNVTGTTNTNDMGLVASMWTQAGFAVQQQQILQSSYIVNALLGDYDVYFWRQFGSTDPDQNYPWWVSTRAEPIGEISLNFARNKDPKIDDAMKTGRESADPAVRNAAYRNVSERLNADLPYLWQNRNLWAVVARPNVVNYDSYTLPDGSAGLGLKAGIFPCVNMWFA